MTEVLIGDVAPPLLVHLVSREAGIFQGWCVTATKEVQQHSTQLRTQKQQHIPACLPAIPDQIKQGAANVLVTTSVKTN